MRSLGRFHALPVVGSWTRTGFRRLTTSNNGASKPSDDTEPKLRVTPLHALHLEQGAKMTGFAGWDMPLQYKDSLLASCRHARTGAALFDVSHMQQLRFRGDDAAEFIETVSVANVKALKPGQGQYTLLTNENGGIIDDMIVTKRPDHMFVVCNAGCAEKDISHFSEEIEAFGKDVEMEVVDDRALVALQGPKAAEVLEAITQKDLSQMGFFFSDEMTLNGVECLVSRSGYTGEDGFEISIPAEGAEEVTRSLLNYEQVLFAGLAARDALRLEAGLCLYSHDLDETTTPIEAALEWTIGKRRRTEGGFPGADVILKQLKEGTTRRRVGITGHAAPARENCEILDAEGNSIGCVTSGTFSPSLNKPVAMGYIDSPHSSAGTAVQLVIRKKNYSGVVTPMPFVQTHYYRPKK